MMRRRSCAAEALAAGSIWRCGAETKPAAAGMEAAAPATAGVAAMLAMTEEPPAADELVSNAIKRCWTEVREDWMVAIAASSAREEETGEDPDDGEPIAPAAPRRFRFACAL